MSILKKVGGMILTLALTSHAYAVSIGWTLNGVTFNDGGTASGTFATDSETGHLLSYDIRTTSGSVLGGFHYNFMNSTKYADNWIFANSFTINGSWVPTYLNLTFENPLTNAGINMLKTGGYAGGGSWECANCSPERNITAGFATSVPAVPEPETYAMLLAGLGLLSFATRRSKPRQQ